MGQGVHMCIMGIKKMIMDTERIYRNTRMQACTIHRGRKIVVEMQYTIHEDMGSLPPGVGELIEKLRGLINMEKAGILSRRHGSFGASKLFLSPGNGCKC